MNPRRLTKMVNDISAFFESEAGAEEAVHEVAWHMRRFWDPRLRREIVAHGASGGDGLSDISRRAVVILTQAVQR